MSAAPKKARCICGTMRKVTEKYSNIKHRPVYTIVGHTRKTGVVKHTCHGGGYEAEVIYYPISEDDTHPWLNALTGECFMTETAAQVGVDQWKAIGGAR